MFNNAGFSSIRATQNAFSTGGSWARIPLRASLRPTSRNSHPSTGLTYSENRNQRRLAEWDSRIFGRRSPDLRNRSRQRAVGIAKASAFKRDDGTFESRPLEDMAPFLPREEVYENMHLFDEETSAR